MRRVALTTIDNPYDPFDEYPQWFAFDEGHGYGTSSFLARILGKVEDLGDAIREEAVEQAVDEIVEFNLLGLWIKVVRETSDT